MSLVLGADFYTLDGRMVQGKLTELTGDRSLVVLTAEGRVEITADQFLAAYFAEPSPDRAKAAEAGLMLRDGSYLGGAVAGGDEEYLFFDHASLGSAKIPIDLFRHLVLASPDLPKAFDPYLSEGEEDILYKTGDAIRGKNYIRGTMAEFTKTSLVFDCNLGLLDVPYAEVEALTLSQEEEEEPAGHRFRILVLLRAGQGMVKCALEKVERDALVVSTLWNPELRIPLNALDSILVQGSGIRHLSDQAPTEVKERPYMGGDEFFLYPFRKDRSVTGRTLCAGGRQFIKGLGIHAKTELTFSLDKQYTAFETFAGISDEVLALPARGSVKIRIQVDENQAYESRILRGGEAPVKVPRIDLKGASLLKVVVDFADGFDSGDRAFLGNPVLVKARE